MHTALHSTLQSNEAGTSKKLVLATKLHGATYQISLIFTASLFLAQVQVYAAKRRFGQRETAYTTVVP